MRIEVGPVASTGSATVAVLPRKLKLAIDPLTRTVEVGAAVPGGELVRGLDHTGAAAEATRNGVVTRREIIRGVIGAVGDGAGPGVNLPIIPRVVILRALDRVHDRVDRYPVHLQDCPRIPETHLVTSIDVLQRFRQNARSCTLAVWRQR